MHGAPLLAGAKLRSFYGHLFHDALVPALGLLVVVVEVSIYPLFAPVMRNKLDTPGQSNRGKEKKACS